MFIFVAAVEVKTKQTFGLPGDCDLIDIWWLLGWHFRESDEPGVPYKNRAHASDQYSSTYGGERRLARTPANQDVPPEVFPLGEEGNGQQSVKVDALHQQPEVTRHDAILEENHHRLAAHLQESTDRSGLHTAPK